MHGGTLNLCSEALECCQDGHQHEFQHQQTGPVHEATEHRIILVEQLECCRRIFVVSSSMLHFV